VLIPSIDLMGGRVVQLRHGSELLWEDDDVWAWVERFRTFPIVQVIDLDAALSQGSNAALVGKICAARRCQVGGGVRSVDRARDLVDSGAARVLVGSALFDSGGVSLERAEAFHEALGSSAFIAAIDSRAGRVVTQGWKHTLSLAPRDAARALEPFAGGFLYTHVDTEGTMSGLDLAPVLELRAATRRRLIVAGGVTTREEVDRLDRYGIDAVVGMAIYTGRLTLT
jgi:phosphoribosylformimino-5-aminoimidazole carboxamide ribotide isomerase